MKVYDPPHIIICANFEANKEKEYISEDRLIIYNLALY